MKVDAPAKINLGLHVLRRRPDGYHDIETVMVRIAWSDTIEAESANDIVMTSSDPELPVGAENLCMKAARVLGERYEIRRGARLHLTKRIPIGAGLGGGSSDAAATLRLLSRFWDLPATDHELAEIGVRIGADVPFFLGPSPALAEGIGESLTAVGSADGSLLQLPFTFVVVKPVRSVSTADAYRWIRPSDRPRENLSDLIRTCDLDRWRVELTNDFEESVAARLPEIGAIKHLLDDAGAGFAGMSGSGSAVFGVFEDAQRAETARKEAQDRGHLCWCGGAV
ncbi:MAG TPA: 4-(cytidine 5'-diphospho)-2-C-methyl-D-erythritol kinase [Rhodothermales bacterium]|nr:4-(cytidine 5'-diphospho)-2-C-methyl-D-erythritol kinase [Rhodothermales bacterium]